MRAILELLKDAAPEEHTRIVRYLSRIEIDRLGQPTAGYDARFGQCLVDAAYLRDWPSHVIAGSVVHEATHARLDRAGFGYGSTDERDRVERRCVLAQIAVLVRLGAAEETIEYYIAQLTGPRWYDPASTLLSKARRLSAAGAPSWIVHWFERRADRLERPSA
jgi:hypothetical protein